MEEDKTLWDKMFNYVISQIEIAKKQGDNYVIVNLKDYCDFLRFGFGVPESPLIDRLLEKLIDLGYFTYAKMVKDTTLKIEWEEQQ